LKWFICNGRGFISEKLFAEFQEGREPLLLVFYVDCDTELLFAFKLLKNLLGKIS